MPNSSRRRKNISEQLENPNIAFLKRRSLWFLKQITSFKNEVDEHNFLGVDESIMSVRLEQLERMQTQFEDVQSQLEKEDNTQIESEARSEFLDSFIAIKSAIMKGIGLRASTFAQSSTRRQSVMEESHGPSITVVPRSRLPPLQLPRFSGAITEWPDFWAMFSAVVDKETNLSGVEKFQHLRSCVSGVALDAIRSLEINAENYEKAVTLLKRRFDIKKVQFQAHIKEIFNLKGVAEGSASDLRQLSDKISGHLRALQTIASNDELLNGILIHVVTSKVDVETQSKWEEHAPIHELPSWDLMATFLERRVRIMESVDSSICSTGKQVITKKNFIRKQSVVTASSVKMCVFCNATNHIISTCPLFLNLSPSLRFKEAKRLQLCINCLKRGHIVKNCKSSNCKSCSGKHNTLLHLSPIAQPAPENIIDIPEEKTSLIADLKQPSDFVSKEHVMLATAVVMLKNSREKFIPCRALLDSASQLHCITSDMANRLQVRKSQSSTLISGIGASDILSKESVVLSMRSADGSYSAALLAVVVPTITTLQPEVNLSNIKWNIPANLPLADPSFFRPQKVDLLIGASLFFELLCVGQICLQPNLPLLQKTRLGWIVAGNVKVPPSRALACITTSNKAVDTYLSDLVKSSWEVEGHTEENMKRTNEESACEEHFVSNFRRLASGEYLARLPMKASSSDLGDSYSNAVRRFKGLEKRFAQNPELQKEYSSFIKEYLELKHMSLVKVSPPAVRINFLPHHCVLKADSTTTKLRVVFDASAPTSTGFSLNDILLTGPTIQPKLSDTLLRFRSHKIAITADISKMYRCVRLDENDSYLQCILWRENAEQEFSIYRLDTVTYGTKPAAFLAIRAMHQLAYDEAHVYPLGAEIVLRDFYVDDLISGGKSESEVLQIMTQTQNLLEKGNFMLRKWCSSNQNIVRDIEPSNRQQYLKFSDGSGITKTLGIVWDPTNDEFQFEFNLSPQCKRVTKRSVLSATASFYDPLGLVGPVVLKAKIFLQSLWKQNLAWDESLPQSLQFAWKELCDNLSFGDKSCFPRFVNLEAGDVQIHGFCDASMAAYGACVYVRVKILDTVHVNLLCSKSRVAPLKTLTIPKLELCAAKLLAGLISSVRKLGPFKGKFICWSDSTIALSWINAVGANYNVFVANRISNIQDLTQGMTWRHIPTEFNPADILSRGCTPRELKLSSLWKYGPDFLKEEDTEWPKITHFESTALEKRRVILIAASKVVDYSLNCKYLNDFRSIQRIYAYVYRFIKTRSSISEKPTLLSLDEIESGSRLLIRMIQMAALPDDYAALKPGRTVKASSKISSLNPFLDEDGQIRVGGRLQNSNFNFNARHPIILPRYHPLTASIIDHHHRKLLHAGPQALLATIRLQYWPIGGRKTVSRVLNKCIQCFRAKPTLLQNIMGELPAERVQMQRPFTTTGVDFCGPFYYKSSIRNRPPTKTYICIFICFATKACHLELVNDLTTASFLAALKRFVSLRGKPRVIWSDNATNFVGAKNELKEIRALMLDKKHVNSVQNQCLDDGIDWRFIPPRSPHFGGLWEAAVKMAKFYFRRAVGLTVLGFEELRTLVYQIAAIINSRPLCPISESPDDLEVLTPAHFLTGGPLTAVAEPNIVNIEFNRLSQWQMMTCIQQGFWKKWSTAYLTLLQERSKWRQKTSNIAIDSLVLLKDDHLPTMKWQMGRVADVVKGRDGIARVATIRTTNGNTQRSITKLCLLPVEEVKSS